MAIGRPRVPTIERFNARTRPMANGCIEWIGYLDRDGYGQLSLPGRRGKTVRAHRWAYEYFVAPIPAGLVIDHLCRNRRCVNPAHMEAVRPEENTRRGNAPTTLNARKTHCVRGHSLTGYNVLPVKGGRACRTCRVEATRRWREANRKAA